MKERPILFSGPMVRALLAHRKTQTRRKVKLAVPNDADEAFFWSGDDLRRQGYSNVADTGLWARKNGRDGYLKFGGPCPYGAPGDRLWVRETWCEADTASGFDYAANFAHDTRGYGWRPSIHMPRVACRLTLAITDVRIERLHDISDADAEAEGVREPTLPPIHMVSAEACGEVRRDLAPPSFLWRMIWTGINGAESWDANPWVWAVSFEVLRADTPTTPGPRA